MSKELIDKFNSRFGQLKQDRISYEAVWQDIIDNIAPDLDGYINKKTDSSQQGNRSDTVIYDAAPVDDCLKCAAGLYASISSPSRPWFVEEMDNLSLNEAPAARQWLDDVTELKYKIMRSSNFYPNIYTVYLHQAAIGTSAMLILPNFDNVIQCTTLNVGQYWLGCDDNGEADTLYREFELTAAQLIQRFGDAVPEKIRNSVKTQKRSEARYTVIHAIEPNMYNMGDFPKPWVSVYYLLAGHENQFLSINGFGMFPVVAPRWFVNSGETYGKMNPGRNALADCKQLQTMVYDYHEALQKVNNPPLQGSDDILVNGQVTTIPGTFNALQSGTTPDTMIKPLFALNPDLATQWASIEAKKRQISQRFYVDMFLSITMRQDKDMTAEEVRALAGERMLGLSPGLENMNSALSKALDIIDYYATEAGIVPEPPQEIQGQSFEHNYVSVLAQAQKVSDVSRITQMVEMAVGMAGASQNPEILDNVDFDAAIAHANKMINAPAGVIRGKDEVARLRAQRQQQQQAQQMAASMQQAAEIAKTAAAAPTDSDNALTRTMQSMGAMQQ